MDSVPVRFNQKIQACGSAEELIGILCRFIFWSGRKVLLTAINPRRLFITETFANFFVRPIRTPILEKSINFMLIKCLDGCS